MSAMDHVIADEDDARFVDMQAKMGPLSAIAFRDQFNVACVMLTGFERYIKDREAKAPRVFLAPIDSMSSLIN